MFVLGAVAWTWVVRRWAIEGGREQLLEGNRPLYFLVAAITFWPVAVGLWLLAYPDDRRAGPWAEVDEPLRYMDEADAESLARIAREDTGLQVRAVSQGTHFVVDIDTPETRYRLTSEDQWPDLRRRLTGQRE